MDTVIILALCGLLVFFLTMDVLLRKPRQRRHHLPRRAFVRQEGRDGSIGYATYVIGGGPALTLPSPRKSGAVAAAKTVPGGIVLRPARF